MGNKAVMHDPLHFPGCFLSPRRAPLTLRLMVFYGPIRDRRCRRRASYRSLVSLRNHLHRLFSASVDEETGAAGYNGGSEWGSNCSDKAQ